MREKILNVKLSDLKVGMRVGKTIIDSNTGTILIKKGEIITHSVLFEIKNYFEKHHIVKFEFIETSDDEIFKINGEEHFLPQKIKAPKDILKKSINFSTYQKAIETVSNLIKNINSGENFDLKEIEDSVGNLINNILDNEVATLNLLNIKKFDDYTYTHSVNVSSIAILIGTKLNLKKEELLELGSGALMHDLGKIKIPPEIINKTSKLTDEEFEIMKKHPVYTDEILKSKNLSTKIRKIASQHHEKFDGTGYPKKLSGNKIDFFAKIVSVADVYDALTTDRIYRRAMLPYDAVKIIISGSGTHFDSDIVKVFLRTFSIYPAGSYVKLNTGEIAVVKKVNHGNLLKPDIVIITNKYGKAIEEFSEIKLSEDKRYIIGPASI